jgi:CubicO group peptidase (beta-lactamase class C family)
MRNVDAILQAGDLCGDGYINQKDIWGLKSGLGGMRSSMESSWLELYRTQEQRMMASAENPLTEELAKFVQEKLDEWKVPGISVGVIDKDQVFTAVRLYF